MAQEINLGGAIYISSKRASEITGYTQDYIGQLARGGNITAQRVSGLWYVVEDSLREYKSKADEFKPTPPPVRNQVVMDSSVSFDGKDYVSANRAAELTGYHPDYVGQLARSGKVPSRQVGNRWFVDREAVAEHKRHNDALLAAVQADSVGLQKNTPVVPTEIPLHYTYEKPVESPSFSPEIESRIGDINKYNDISDDNIDTAEEINEIPIRVIRPIIRPSRPGASLDQSIKRYRGSYLTRATVVFTLLVFISASGAYLYVYKPAVIERGYSIASTSLANHSPLSSVSKIILPGYVTKFISNSLYYRRDSF